VDLSPLSGGKGVTMLLPNMARFHGEDRHVRLPSCAVFSRALFVSGGGSFSGAGFNCGVHGTRTIGSVLIDNLNVSRVGLGGIQPTQNGSSSPLIVRGCTVGVCGGTGFRPPASPTKAQRAARVWTGVVFCLHFPGKARERRSQRPCVGLV
jgi:hypothetical protein